MPKYGNSQHVVLLNIATNPFSSYTSCGGDSIYQIADFPYICPGNYDGFIDGFLTHDPNKYTISSISVSQII